MKRIVAIICLIWALIFQRSQTEYFGNNFLPQTNEEIICDITSLMLVICASIILWQKRK